MQNVSRQYKESMRGIGRNRGYIRATIGIVNSRAQESAAIDKGQNSLLYFSDVQAPFSGERVDRPYAMPEEDFSRIDGTMYFPPPAASTPSTFYNNGAVSQGLLGSITVSFGTEEKYDIKGLTIDFGECHPTSFTIENDKRVLSYSGNQNQVWTTEDSFDGTSFIKITPVQMVNGQGRLRIYRFSCGVTNTFTNDDIMDYTGREFVSPISETLPTNDVSLTVKNYDLYYLPDDPESAIAYMEQGQEVKIAFGYDVDGKGTIEWLPERTSYLKSWKADESRATFTATDIFSTMPGMYYKGMYRPDGITLYDLAVDVLQDAGIANYFLDSYLKEVVVYNPMPVVSHPSALQIIANAGRCTLTEDRQGRIHIQASFIPSMEATANNEAAYSHVGNILSNSPKEAYANASMDFSVLDGSLKFLPQGGPYLNTGYASESIWVEEEEGIVKNRLSYRLGGWPKAFDVGGYWDGDMPVITISLEAVYTAFGFGISFRNTAPQKFTIATYKENQLVDFVTVNNPDLSYYTDRAFLEFDKMEIAFTAGYRGSRVFVDSVLIGDATDYEIDRMQLHSAPVATREAKIKDVTVTYSDYKESAETVTAASGQIFVPEEDYEYVAYFNKPTYGLLVFASSADSDISAQIVDSSNYYAKIKFTGVPANGTTVSYSISGYEYLVSERKYSKQYNSDGESKTWNNPLISSQEHAADLERWLAEHFLGNVEYEIDWRGDPATDAGDLYHLETKIGMVPIRGYDSELTFSGAWHGRMKARRVTREWDGIAQRRTGRQMTGLTLRTTTE